jgi:hypothetical protein
MSVDLDTLLQSMTSKIKLLKPFDESIDSIKNGKRAASSLIVPGPPFSQSDSGAKKDNFGILTRRRVTPMSITDTSRTEFTTTVIVVWPSLPQVYTTLPWSIL